MGGYDYVGEVWPGDPLAPSFDPALLDPNPNPIDIEGHGTQVVDIVGGITDGAPGVAPDTEIIALRVCASFAPNCEGGAILQAIDFALNPQDDPDFGEAAHIINMSLGLNYGTSVGDPIADAVTNATAAGILTVASAGNSSDNPYTTGTPAAIPSALSVAWTTLAADGVNVGSLLTDPPHDFPMVYQDWSGEYDTEIQATVSYGTTAAEQLGCDPADGESNPWALPVPPRGGARCRWPSASPAARPGCRRSPTAPPAGARGGRAGGVRSRPAGASPGRTQRTRGSRRPRPLAPSPRGTRGPCARRSAWPRWTRAS